jgi:hypothetical protein
LVIRKNCAHIPSAPIGFFLPSRALAFRISFKRQVAVRREADPSIKTGSKPGSQLAPLDAWLGPFCVTGQLKTE